MLQVKPCFSREDYLLLEAQSDVKHEFLAGQAYAMAGGTFNHARVAGNLFASLRQLLRGKPCQPDDVLVLDTLGISLALNEFYTQ
ncbi:Uma2 family endonuclease [Candidatus Thiothrix anitrata]|uniref:Uma2 family endonuclease n=1 Tax=Candidatus Thiothrix anitrata TaxID=2823902 RepID=A0ABX7X5Y1_9GAMM|nr:Uma2 family endonuclease [Candidatus Thiothrix anitrata]QTR51274.1 Uma2 family endonuclease [Candidatus Thiothrix anitrata]